MLSKVTSGSVIGVEGVTIFVETDITKGFPSFEIVGLPDSAIKESKERVRSAIKNSGFMFPVKKIIVNLAPANLKKEGPSFDLPIAVAILSCIGATSYKENVFIAGELALNGDIRPITGILPMVHEARRSGIKHCIVPFDNAEEAALIEGVHTIPVRNLAEVVEYLNGKPFKPYKVDIDEMFSRDALSISLDFADVKGQESVKRALEISAAGYHNVLMIGPPGSGKTMMAKRMPTILPDLSFEESIDVTKIYSVAGLLENRNALITKRPFRYPHHTISYAALTGGGRYPKPGEISLAHNGVLFLDELPEFNKNVLEVLRQPLEDSSVTISRVNGTVTYPANFMLVTSLNPCPCGFYGNEKKCSCTPKQVKKYLGKVSGPLLDRIDIQVEASPVKYEELGSRSGGEKSREIKSRIEKAHRIQKERYKEEDIIFNSQLSASQIEKYCPLDDDSEKLIKQAFEVIGMSARAYHKILKTARTIADLSDSKEILSLHVAEAIQYRSLDRKYWG